MARSIHCQRLNHLNIVGEDFDATIALFQKVYGAEFLADIPSPEWHAGLFDIGRAIFEIFTPHQFLLNARYGSHYLGVEYQADMEAVRAAIADRGIRIIRDVESAVHTHPADSYGVAFEFYSGWFHDREWASLGGAKIAPAAWWRDEHPLGLTGLRGYTLAVADIGGCAAFLTDFLEAQPVYEAPRPALAGRSIGLRIADSLVELVTPTSDGVLRDHLHRFGDGIRSAVFGVRDLGQAARHLAAHGIAHGPGGAPDTLAVDPAGNAGVIFEFAA